MSRVLTREYYFVKFNTSDEHLGCNVEEHRHEWWTTIP